MRSLFSGTSADCVHTHSFCAPTLGDARSGDITHCICHRYCPDDVRTVSEEEAGGEGITGERPDEPIPH